MSQNDVCIKNGNIYIKGAASACTKIYGNGGSGTNGVKIFQKGATFNKYSDVTSTLGSVTANEPELTPFFVIYDCSSSSGCSQTSGFVKYGTGGDTRFMNCYTQKDIDKPTDEEVNIPYVIGSVILNDDSIGTNCNEEKGTTGSCRLNESTFTMCSSVKLPNNSKPYKEISMTIGSEGHFFFTNGDTPFPNTQGDGGKVFLKIDANSAVLSRSKILLLLFFFIFLF